MDEVMFTVTDVKQMGYCARIAYYAYCLPGLTPAPTYKMEAGALAGRKTEELEHRRSLRAYGLKEEPDEAAGEAGREFDVWLESPKLGLRGRLDMLIEAAGELIPVDYKDSDPRPVAKRGAGPRQAQHNWQVQLAAYALLLEEARGQSVQRGFIYYIPERRARPVAITEDLKTVVIESVGRMRDIIARERMPDATPYRGRCQACEYRRFCNDV